MAKSAAPVATVPPVAPAALYIPGHSQTPENEMPLVWANSVLATSYNLYRSTTSGSGYSLVTSGIVGTEYTNITASSCVGYFYVVTAVNSGGESGYSMQTNGTNIDKSTSLVATVNIYTNPMVGTPGSPSATVAFDCAGGYSGAAEMLIEYEIYAKDVSGYFSAAGVGISAYDDGTTGPFNVNLSWSAVSGATEYRAYRQVDGGGFNDYYLTASTSVTDDGGPSAIAGSPPPTPVGNGAVISTSVTLTWDAPPACNTSTSIRRSEIMGGPYYEIGSISGPLTTFVDYPGTSSTYYYVIVFNTSVHQSEFSNEQQAFY